MTKDEAIRLYLIPAEPYASERAAIDDWLTIAPEHRTQERLDLMKSHVAMREQGK